MTVLNEPTPLPAHVSRMLDAAYQHHVGGSTAPPPPSLAIVDGRVDVSVSGNGSGEFSAFLDALRAVGLEILSSHQVTWAVTGRLPLDQLPAAARLPAVRSIAPRLAPRTY